jgi:SAM-dependent methyltransferase
VPNLTEFDLAEIARSAEEAARIEIRHPDREQIERYVNPPFDTAFPLEYAFWMLGDVHGKSVLDLGCGSGENILALVERGARVTGIDISPELISLAGRRLEFANLEAAVQVGSAYETGLPDASVDVIFCIALIHHLDIERVRKEMDRILVRDGKVILMEPVRFSNSYDRLRKLLPARDNVSEYEHPLTKVEFATINKGFNSEGTKFFRLPFVPLLLPVVPARSLFAMDKWCLRTFPAMSYYATCVVTKLSK